MFIAGILAQVNPVIFKIVVDEVFKLLEDPDDLSNPAKFFGLLIGILIIKEMIFQSLNIYIGYVGEKIKVTIAKDMNNQAIQHVSTLGIDFFDQEKNQEGKIVKRLDQATEGMSKVVKNIIIDILPLLFTSIMAICLMFYSNWKVGLLSIAIIPFFMYSSIRQAKINEGTRHKIQDYKEKRSQKMISFVNSIKLIKSYIMEEQETDRISDINTGLYLDEIKHHYINRLYDGYKKFFENIGEVAILGFTSYLVYKGEMTAGAILLHMLLYRNITSPITHLHRIFDEYQEAVQFSDGYFSLLEEKPKISDPIRPKSISNLIGEIRIENVFFKYPESNELVLNDVSIDLKPGSLNALVGVNGAGKTTIVYQLLRFYDPIKGNILIDGINIKDISKSDIRNNIGVVLQKEHFVFGTIKDNLRYGKINATNEDMWNILEMVELKDDVMKFADKLEHSAKKLSGGQQQKLAIARVIIKDPKILILDEPTSAIDVLALNEIDSIVKEIRRGRTTLVISHNMASIVEADQIIVLQKGKVIQKGNHKELDAATDGHYHKLMKAYKATIQLDIFQKNNQ